MNILMTPAPVIATAPRLGRRRLLAGTATWIATPTFIRNARAQETRRLTPAQTEGPFYPVTLPADSDADLLVQGPLRYTQGQPAWLEGVVMDTAGRPVNGALARMRPVL